MGNLKGRAGRIGPEMGLMDLSGCCPRCGGGRARELDPPMINNGGPSWDAVVNSPK
jgi:hypothetical protein